MKSYYFFVDSHNIERGPVNIDLIRTHGINSNTLVWFDGMPVWVKAATIPELHPHLKPIGIESTFDKTPPVAQKDNTERKTLPPAFKDIDEKLKAQIKMMTPKNWLMESILVTLFCLPPLGIVGIIYGSKVNSLWQNGKFAESLRASNLAAKWTKWGFMIAFTLWLVWIIFLWLFPQSFNVVDFYNSYFDW